MKGCPFPKYSGNDLWILNPGEPRLLPPQLVPLRAQARPRLLLSLGSLDPAFIPLPPHFFFIMRLLVSEPWESRRRLGATSSRLQCRDL